jgi:hypothetical protein
MITFCILGDMGSGEISQHNVAKSMYENIKHNKVKFICGLGDNIYPSGCYNIDDKQFIEKFEEPYKMIPDDIKFYMCLGNHDYGNYWEQKFRNCSNNQIEYGIKSQILDKKWYLPGNYYTFSKEQGNIKIDFFVIDTNLELMSDTLKKEQMKFTAEALKESKADWKILYGHHTFISIAGHGNAEPELDKYLRKLLRLGVDMYMNGHDHTKQIIEFNIGGRMIPIITCGTGGMPYDDGPLNYSNIKKGSKLVWNAETIGFGTVFCDKKLLRLELYDENNILEKEYTFNKKSNISHMKASKKTKKKNSKIKKNMRGSGRFSKMMDKAKTEFKKKAEAKAMQVKDTVKGVAKGKATPRTLEDEGETKPSVSEPAEPAEPVSTEAGPSEPDTEEKPEPDTEEKTESYTEEKPEEGGKHATERPFQIKIKYERASQPSPQPSAPQPPIAQATQGSLRSFNGGKSKTRKTRKYKKYKRTTKKNKR